MSIEKSVISPTLIGRETDLQALDELLDQTKAGIGNVSLIAGEAGIGKSRLIAETITHAGPAFQKLAGRCFETDLTYPYAPLLDLLRTFLTTHSAREISEMISPLSTELIKILPELNYYLPDIEATSSLEPEQEKHRLFQALVQFFVKQTAKSPLLIILEDLHWSDSTSLELILYLTRHIATKPILILLSYRPEELTQSLRHFLTELDRERLGREFVLTRLSSSGVDALIRAIFELDRPTRADFLSRIYELTEGNPFFIEEILKALITIGDIFFTEGVWDRKEIHQLHIPRSVQDAVQRRTGELSPLTQQALVLAAVAGKRFNFELLRELIKTDDDQLTMKIKELIAAQLVVEESKDQFVFRHALIREAIHAGLLGRERQKYHFDIAETIERIYENSLVQHVTDLSYHYYEAEIWDKSLKYSRQAGQQADKLYSPREALLHFSRAIQSSRNLPDPPLLGPLLRSRGKTYETLGEFDSALADYNEALILAQQTDDRIAEWECLMDTGSLWAGRDYQKTGEFFINATNLAEGMNDPRLHAQSLNRLANWSINVGQNQEGTQKHLQALSIFEDLKDAQGSADTLDLLGMAALQSGNGVDSYNWYARAIKLYEELNNKPGLIAALIGACHASYWSEADFIPLESMDHNIEQAMQALNLVRQNDWPAAYSYVNWSFALGLANYGDFGKALDLAQESLRIATEIEHRQWIVGAHYALGHVYLSMLQAELAITHLENALTIARELGSNWWNGNVTTDLSNAYLLRNSLSASERVLEAGYQAGKVPGNMVERRMLWARGRLCLAMNKPSDALAISDQLLDLAPAQVKTQPIPWLLKLKGESQMVLGHLDEAEETLQLAKIGAHERFARPLLWQIHLSIGNMYQKIKKAEQAESEYAAAREIIQSLASTIEEGELRGSFLSAALATLPKVKSISQRRAETQKYGGLTEREREVAGLIAKGKSNRAIAEALVLSERTVENHVANILAKLTYDSRAQIAVWAAEQGLAKGSS
jgi:DNA-binding CsgD family transcriptional regulator